DRPADERQRELETGAENDRIEGVAGSVGKAYGLAVDRFEPWPRSDSSFRHQMPDNSATGSSRRRRRCRLASERQIARGFRSSSGPFVSSPPRSPPAAAPFRPARQNA